MARKKTVYSIYHNMEERGIFEANPANVHAVNNDGLSTYKGPVEFPKSLYHPTGEMIVTFQGLMVTDPKTGDAILDRNGDPKFTGQQKQVKTVTVGSKEEEEDYLNKGWHLTEAAARRLSTDPRVKTSAPPKTKMELMEERLAEQEKELALLRNQAAPGSSGKVPVAGKAA